MKRIDVLAWVVALCVSVTAEEASKSESLLGKPVTVLLPDTLEDYEITISHPRAGTCYRKQMFATRSLIQR